MQSFFDGIPKELEEAAMIDGATRFGALPPDRPAADAARHRRDTRLRLHGGLERAALRADAELDDRSRPPSPSGCSPSSRKFSVDFGQMMAAGVLALIPVCIFFFLIQRYLVQGLTAGAVKG